MDSDSDQEKTPRRLESLAAEQSPAHNAESQSHRKTLERLQKLRMRSSQSRHSVSTVSNKSRGSAPARRWREKPKPVFKGRVKKANSEPLWPKQDIDFAVSQLKNEQAANADADTGRVVISSHSTKRKRSSNDKGVVDVGTESKRKRHSTSSSKRKGSADRDFVDQDAEGSGRQSRDQSSGSSRSQSPKDLKKECAGQPPAWALAKAELVYTLPWINSPMSSSYHTLDYGVHGHLIDKDYCRYIDEEIIIITLSGSYKQTSHWKWVLKASQTYKNNIQARAWYTNYLENRPMGMIIGDKCDMINTKLPYRLNVMDHFMVTDIWQDDVNGLLRFSVRLQKLDLLKKSWWAEKGSPEPPTMSARKFEALAKSKQCNGTDEKGKPCGGFYWQIYECGWMCLNPVCKNYWLVDGVKAGPADDQQFHKGFLCYRRNFNVEEALKKIRYPLIPQVDLDKEDSHTRRDGVLCPKCKRCVPRTYLGYWKCDLQWFSAARVDEPREHEKGCPWEHKLIQKVCGLNEAQLLEVNNAFRKLRKTHPPSFDGYIRIKEPLFSYDQYMGTVTHFVSNQRINAKPNGPDDLFKLLQTSSSDIGFRRHRGSHPTVPGTLSNNFLQNLGLPYNFFVPNKTRGFNEISRAHPRLMHAYARLDWAFRQAADADGTNYHRPNEVLMIGYLQGQKIQWHDDGDGKLGPQIATLCLGAKARMMLRIKADYHYGLNSAGKPLKEEAILKGCENEELRTELRNQFLTGKISQEEYDELRKKNLRRPYRSTAGVQLELILHHGDIVVMNGVHLQKYYEHTVESIDDMRFAITARHLLEDDKSVKYQMKKWKVGFELGHYNIKAHEVYNGN